MFANEPLVITQFYGNGIERPWLRIDRAEPVARISAEMLQEISIAVERGETKFFELRDNVLTVRARNRTVVYVIDHHDWDAATDTYGMHWPDLHGRAVMRHLPKEV